MGLLLMILASAVLGSFLTLLAQFLLLYRRQPEPPADEAARAGEGFRYIKPVPGLLLREYLYGGGRDEEPSGAAPEGGATPTAAPETPAPPTRETCYFLNATILFLFRELRDTALTRRWVTKKIKVEFEELLQTKTAGRLLEGLSLRDVFLGETVPFIKTIRLVRPVVPSATGEPDGPEGEALPAACPEELAFEAEVEYNGGFHLAIDVDLVFGKSAYLFVKLSRVVGRLRLVFTRVPFTHWFFSFVEDPLIDFEVRSQFEGRPMPQLTSIIVNQLKKIIKRKHTLPSYKIRFKPFFPYQTLQGFEEDEEHIHIQQWALTEGRLKVTLLECSRLLIFGSYDREANVHCTLELSSSVWEEKQRSSIKTVELIKGNLQSVGLTLRLVQSTDGYAGHVIIETVAPNSPAAIADLQRGDRLIAIGGVKITSTLQVLKLIKQAGDRVLVYYERPVGQSNQGAVLQDNFGQLEENFLSSSCQSAYEEEAAGLTVDTESRELDSEFEDLASDVRAQNEFKDEAQSLSHSPKRTPTTLSVKPLGAISPVLNRKLAVGSHPLPPKIQSKDGNKPPSLKTSEITDPAQVSKPTQGSTFKPPVPPRPQVKVPLPSTDAPNQAEPDVLVEKPEKVPPPPLVDKSAEKQAKNVDPIDDAAASKQFLAKQEVAKDVTSETSCPTKDSSDDRQTWESSEILYRNKLGKWTRTRASCLFDIEACHRYLNIALWCRDPFKLGGLICLGHVSLKLEDVALGCLATSNMEYLSKLRLEAPSPKAIVTRTALRNLSMQKGFNDKFCYGDITIHFKYLKEGESDHHVVTNVEKEKEPHLVEEVSVLPKEEQFVGQMGLTENKHSFQDTQFQNPTWCDYCKKKVWTKAASQCMFCAYVCHKKCQEKCLAETSVCGATDRRIDRTLKNLRLEGQETLLGLPPRVDAEASKSVNKTTGLTRHIINTSSRLLNLRQVSKTRLSEPGTDLVEPSPKHTPNTSDNEGSDTEVCGPNSPSKRGNSTGIKLVRKEGGLDDSVFIAVKEIGRDLYRGLPTEERIQKLEFMLDKLQNEIDQELEHNNSLVREEKETTDTRKKSLLSAALAKSGERLQALTLLMIHYRAGIEDIETLESLSLDQHSKKISKYTDDTEEDLDNEISQLIDSQPFSSISDDLFGPSESV
ncbi:PDZ domain-containing protein 8 isoform X1 [Trachypithecus francoisi]|uniref:PDZ domain-containing protein 8 isoform X1 n=1 Tax=Trachypithecus francoisi TaxID=54180 RepID=UPI00141ADBDF|nr:PDZ domain-containing protein 8 isoform X1 [Trachypithecus francoisi]